MFHRQPPHLPQLLQSNMMCVILNCNNPLLIFKMIIELESSSRDGKVPSPSQNTDTANLSRVDGKKSNQWADSNVSGEWTQHMLWFWCSSLGSFVLTFGQEHRKYQRPDRSQFGSRQRKTHNVCVCVWSTLTCFEWLSVVSCRSLASHRTTAESFLGHCSASWRLLPIPPKA